MFKNMKLSTKLISGFVGVACITIIVGIISVISLRESTQEIDEIGNVRLPGVQGLLIMSAGQRAALAGERGLVDRKISNEVREANFKYIENALEKAKQGLAIYEPLPQTEEEAMLWKEFVPAWEEWLRDNTEVVTLIKEKHKLLQEGANADDENIAELDTKAYEASFVTARASYIKSDALLSKLVDLNVEIAAETVEHAHKKALSFNVLMIVSVILGGIFAVLLGLFLSKSITTPIFSAVNKLSEANEQVNSATAQLAATSQQLSEASNEQAATVEETTSAVDELGSLTMRNADNSSKANDLSREVKHVVDQANTLMTNMVSAMGEIKSSSNEISKVIKVIDDIAFQTNILALNAAVEAARAGEAGAGFAVVADEVRNLAQRSAEAAKETSAMIENSLTKTEIGVKNTEEVDKILKQINESVETSTSLMEEVSVASQEQTKGLDEISRAIQQISTTAQSNASAAEETSASADDLSNQAETLRTIVGQLNAILTGGDSENIRQVNSIKATKHYSNPKKSMNGSSAIKPEVIIPMDNDDNFV